jgi:hypothetical protein
MKKDKKHQLHTSTVSHRLADTEDSLPMQDNLTRYMENMIKNSIVP